MPLASLDQIRDRVGQEVGVSSWLLVDQARIDAFADATEDRQFIHVDPTAAAQTPFGGTIAHGFLTLALLSRMAAEAKARRVTIYLAVTGEASAESIDAVGAAAEAAVSSQKGCKLVRCVLAGAGGGSLMFDLVYDDSTRDTDRLATDRAAILRALIEALAAKKLHLVRASDQATAPLPL